MTVLARPDLRVRSAFRLWQRNATIYKRSYRASIIPNFFEPFFYLLAMGLGLGAYLSHIQGIRYIDYIAPGLVATAAMYGASFEVTYNCFVKMHFGKIYDAIAATPLSPEDIALGELLWATTRSLLYGSVFLVIAAMFGVVHTPLVVFAPAAIALIGLMFALIGLTFTALVPKIDYFSFYWTMFMTPMFLFAGIFFPLTRLPGWVEVLAWFVPLHQAVDLMRAIVLTGDAERALGAAVWIVVVNAALFVIPLRLMRRRLIH